MSVTRSRFLSVFASVLVVPACARRRADAVRIGATSIDNNMTIAEIYAMALEQHGIAVKRRQNFDNAEQAMSALQHGDIDLYPDYLQTRAGALQRGRPSGPAGALTDGIKSVYERHYGITWLSPSRAVESPCLATSQYAAEEFSLLTLSKCAQISPQLRLAATPEFLAEGGALQGLHKLYGGFHFKTTASFEAGTQYYALNRGDADVASASTTAAEIAEGQLIVLGDDKHFWPEYKVTPIIRIAVMRTRPKIGSVLNRVSEMLSQYAVQQLSMRRNLLRMDPSDLAEDFLRTN